MLKLEITLPKPSAEDAAAFGRLCVETLEGLPDGDYVAAAAFGRLCVETNAVRYNTISASSSRLRAAVC